MSYDEFLNYLDQSKFQSIDVKEDNHPNYSQTFYRFSGQLAVGAFLEVFGNDLNEIYSRIPKEFKRNNDYEMNLISILN